MKYYALIRLLPLLRAKAIVHPKVIGKARLNPIQNNTENSVAEYTAGIFMHDGDKQNKILALAKRVPWDWFSRLDYYVCATTRSNPNSTWLHGIEFDSVDVDCEVYESIRANEKDYLDTFAGILRWLRESMMKRSSTNFCSVEGISLRLWDEDPDEKFIFPVYGEFWDAEVKSLTRGKITWTEGENIEEAWRRHQAQLEIDEMSEIYSKAALKRTRRRSCPPGYAG